MSETKTPVPVGWVRLTRGDDGHKVVMRASRIEVVEPHYQIADDEETVVVGAKVWVPTDVISYVTESPAEVVALVAEAQRAERRANAMPGLVTAHLQSLVTTSDQDRLKAAVHWAVATLDAIEARE